MTARRFRAVLFDLDGTLVDSGASVARNWRILAGILGRPPESIVGRFHGMPVSEALRVIDPDLPEARVQELNNLVVSNETADSADVVALPGAAAALRELPGDRIAIVTSCSRPLALARLAAAGLTAPAVMVTADDVVRGKPHPDPFLAGAGLLGVPAADCLVVEDAPAGVQAARAAGCFVLGVGSTSSAPDADTVPDLSHLTWSVESDGIVVDY